MDIHKVIGKPAMGLINTNDDRELRVWADKFDVTKAKLKAAINAAGASAKDVEAYLMKHSHK